MSNQYFTNKQALLLLTLNNSKFIQVDNVIEYMLKHSSEFALKMFNIASDHLDFDHEKITKLLNDYLLNPSLTDQELINVIYLKTNILKLSLKLENPQNLLKIFHKLINEKKYDESLLVSIFLADCGNVSELHEYKNDENIPKDIKSDLYSSFSYNELNEEEFISILLSDKRPETNNSLIEALFNLMMKEKQNRIGYLICILEKLKKIIFQARTFIASFHYKIRSL